MVDGESSSKWIVMRLLRPSLVHQGNGSGNSMGLILEARGPFLFDIKRSVSCSDIFNSVFLLRSVFER